MDPTINAPKKPAVRPLIGLLLAMVLAAVLHAGALNLDTLQQDLRMLNDRVAANRSRLKRDGADGQALRDVEAKLDQLRQCMARLAALNDRLANIDGRLRYLRTMELEPKNREVERVRQMMDQRMTGILNQLSAIGREMEKHNASQPDPSNAAASAAYQKRADDGNTRLERLKADLKRIESEGTAEIERAIQAHARALKDCSEAEAKRTSVVKEVSREIREYSATRDQMAGNLVELERLLPLTPFPGGASPGQAESTKREIAPIGPGTNLHAIDQLRVVAASSLSAADREILKLPSDRLNPEADTARRRAGYGFDSGEGLPPVQLPRVDVINSENGAEEPAPAESSGAVPLLVPPAPAKRENALRAVKENPRLQFLAQRQAENLRALKDLYDQRRELARQGPGAGAQKWTKVVQDISTKQADITMAAVEEKLAEGSSGLDLSIVPKKTKNKPIEVPLPAQP